MTKTWSKMDSREFVASCKGLKGGGAGDREQGERGVKGRSKTENRHSTVEILTQKLKTLNFEEIVQSCCTSLHAGFGTEFPVVLWQIVCIRKEDY